MKIFPKRWIPCRSDDITSNVDCWASAHIRVGVPEAQNLWIPEENSHNILPDAILYICCLQVPVAGGRRTAATATVCW